MSVNVSATSFLGKQLEYARNLIAASPAWQELCGVETAEEAKAFIEYYATADDSLPRCLLTLGTDLQLGSVWPSGSSGQGTVDVVFYTQIADEDDGRFSDACMNHLNAIGPVLAEIRDLARNANANNGYLAAQAITAGTDQGQLDPDEHNGELIYFSEWVLRHHVV
ncbi:hypothetical protein GYB59_00560 [bacterium]|nr:hypothetical protein [bacterium]